MWERPVVTSTLLWHLPMEGGWQTGMIKKEDGPVLKEWLLWAGRRRWRRKTRELSSVVLLHGQDKPSNKNWHKVKQVSVRARLQTAREQTRQGRTLVILAAQRWGMVVSASLLAEMLNLNSVYSECDAQLSDSCSSKWFRFQVFYLYNTAVPEFQQNVRFFLRTSVF